MTTKQAKERWLRKLDEDTIAKEVLKYALDPYLVYGVTLPKTYPSTSNCDGDWSVNWTRVKHILDALLDKSEPAAVLKKKLSTLDSDPRISPLLRRIVNKDLRCGIGPGIIQTVFPGLLTEFNCQLANDRLPNRLYYPLIVEPKLDGVRVLAFIEGSGSVPKITLRSRTGREYDNFPSIVRALEKSVKERGIVLDGEVTSGSFQELMTEARRTKAKKDSPQSHVVYNVFDFATVEKFKANETDPRYLLRERVDLLKSLITEGEYLKLVKGSVVHEYKDIERLYKVYLKQGYEGIMVKQDCLYNYGRSNRWIKIKPTKTIDLPIMGFIEGTGKYEGKLGALEVVVQSKRVSIGTGFSDSQREEIWRNRNNLIGKVIEVKYQEMTDDGSLRFPVFVKFRPDKD